MSTTSEMLLRCGREVQTPCVSSAETRSVADCIITVFHQSRMTEATSWRQKLSLSLLKNSKLNKQLDAI
eukprot:764311-Hanusia_phi.AAC.10